MSLPYLKPLFSTSSFPGLDGALCNLAQAYVFTFLCVPSPVYIPYVHRRLLIEFPKNSFTLRCLRIVVSSGQKIALTFSAWQTLKHPSKPSTGFLNLCKPFLMPSSHCPLVNSAPYTLLNLLHDIVAYHVALLPTVKCLKARTES